MKYAWLVLLLASCHTYTDVTAGAKGSLENPYSVTNRPDSAVI
jgi:hypothetical protein